jgi:periplasmic mercuric ion binding protein
MKQFRIFAAFLFLAAFLTANISALAADQLETAKIKTTASCATCKDKIEKTVLKIKGVKTAEVNTTDKFVSVSFDPKKTSVDKIRKTMAKAGYEADDVKPPKGKECCKDSKCNHEKDAKCKDKIDEGCKDKKDVKCDKKKSCDPKKGCGIKG